MPQYKRYRKALRLDLSLEPGLGTHPKQYGVPYVTCELV